MIASVRVWAQRFDSRWTPNGISSRVSASFVYSEGLFAEQSGNFKQQDLLLQITWNRRVYM